jgi:hypothetical protein
MVLQPGESTTLAMEFTMPTGMGGPHDFLVHLPTNDATRPDLAVNVISNWVP